jgi:hypothetical protein
VCVNMGCTTQARGACGRCIKHGGDTRRRKQPVVPREGERSSKRVRHQAPDRAAGGSSNADNDKSPRSPSSTTFTNPEPDWSAKWLRDDDEGEVVQWDATRMHQHLELSDSRSVACTTGTPPPSLLCSHRRVTLTRRRVSAMGCC